MIRIQTAVAIFTFLRIHGLRPHGSNTELFPVETQLSTEIEELLKRTGPNEVGRSLITEQSLGGAPGKGPVNAARVDGAIDLMGQTAAQLTLAAAQTGSGKPLYTPSEKATSPKSALKTTFIEAGHGLRSGMKMSLSTLRTAVRSAQRKLGIPIGFVKSKMGFEDAQLRFLASYTLRKGKWLIELRTSVRVSLMNSNLQIELGDNSQADNSRTPANLKWLEFPQDVRLCYDIEMKIKKNTTFDYLCVGARPNIKYYADEGKVLFKTINIVSFFGVTQDLSEEETSSGDPVAPLVNGCFNDVRYASELDSSFDEPQPQNGWRHALAIQVYTQVQIGYPQFSLGPTYKWVWKRTLGTDGKWGQWSMSTYLGVGGEISPMGELAYLVWDIGLGKYANTRWKWHKLTPYVSLPVFNFEKMRAKAASRESA